MIFVTVGSQLPFDRLIESVGAWARYAKASDVLAQVGHGAATPKGLSCVAELDPHEFRERLGAADVVVGHAGTGTIMAALTAGKPVVVLARRVGLGETRNDHQVATVERFRGRPGFYGTVDEAEIPGLIQSAIGDRNAAADDGGSALGPYAKGEIVERLRGFLNEHLS